MSKGYVTFTQMVVKGLKSHFRNMFRKLGNVCNPIFFFSTITEGQMSTYTILQLFFMLIFFVGDISCFLLIAQTCFGPQTHYNSFLFKHVLVTAAFFSFSEYASLLRSLPSVVVPLLRSVSDFFDRWSLQAPKSRHKEVTNLFPHRCPSHYKKGRH